MAKAEARVRRARREFEAVKRQATQSSIRKPNLWIDHAPFDLHCEGLDPGLSAARRSFSAQHVEIVRGDRYFEKTWRTREGVEFVSRHCVGCGRALEPACAQSGH